MGFNSGFKGLMDTEVFIADGKEAEACG